MFVCGHHHHPEHSAAIASSYHQSACMGCMPSATPLSSPSGSCCCPPPNTHHLLTVGMHASTTQQNTSKNDACRNTPGRPATLSSPPSPLRHHGPHHATTACGNNPAVLLTLHFWPISQQAQLWPLQALTQACPPLASIFAMLGLQSPRPSLTAMESLMVAA